MIVRTEILEKLFAKFVDFIQATDHSTFTKFSDCKYFDKAEKYKDEIYIEARETINNGRWKQEDIGTGKIHSTINEAIKTKVIYKFNSFDNNLINNWRLKDDFAKFKPSKTYEQLLFDFYKSKGVKNQFVFDELLKYGHPYNLVAYLFFIKDNKSFLPISQQRFDKIFEEIGLPNFKTSGNASWDNYLTFNSTIKQVQTFLKAKDSNTSLLDAHSFLWIIGNQMKATMNQTTEKSSVAQSESIVKNEKTSKNIFSKSSELNSLEWIEILQNDKLTNELDLSIFQALYSFQDSKAYASQIALILETTHPPLNLEIGRYAKRIAEYYEINFTIRSAEKFKFWDLFFNGWDEGTKFVWQLRPELVEALEATGLTGDEIYPDEFPKESIEELFEGIKRTVTVNSYERNSKARQLCVKHWKAICAVCSFDFEKIYGEIAKGFIHVHHLTPVSKIGKSYQVDPINDLIPVCPNCHSMLHRHEPPLSIEELKSLITR